MRADWDGEFMSDIISPAVQMLWTTKAVPAKYAGFGPRSITNRILKDPKTPRWARAMIDADNRFREALKR